MARVRKIHVLALAVVLFGALSPSALSQPAEREADGSLNGQTYFVIGFNGYIEWGACLYFRPGRVFQIRGEGGIGAGTYTETNYILFSQYKATFHVENDTAGGPRDYVFNGYRVGTLVLNGGGQTSPWGWYVGDFLGVSFPFNPFCF
jgi:hypothetical protein